MWTPPIGGGKRSIWRGTLGTADVTAVKAQEDKKASFAKENIALVFL